MVVSLVQVSSGGRAAGSLSKREPEQWEFKLAQNKFGAHCLLGGVQMSQKIEKVLLHSYGLV